MIGRVSKIALVTSMLSSFCLPLSAQSFDLTFGAPRENQSSYISGTGPDSYQVPDWLKLETFETLDLGSTSTTWAVGNVDTAISLDWGIDPAGWFGGAGIVGGPPAGRYLKAGPTNGVAIKFNTPSNYVGMWWSAGKPSDGDKIQMYAKGVMVGEITVSDARILALGPEYINSDPNRTLPNFHADDSYYVYLNIGSANIFFDEIRLSGNNIEIDNLVIGSTLGPSLQPTANGLAMVLDQQSRRLHEGLEQDCHIYNNAYCVKAVARYSFGDGSAGRSADPLSGDQNDYGAGSFVLSVRPQNLKQFRIGAFLDVDASTRSVFQYDHRTPPVTAGAFLGFSEDGPVGLQLKASAAYRQGRVEHTRFQTLPFTEAGHGAATIAGFGLRGEVGYGIRLSKSLVTTPFLAMTFSDLSRGRYTETNDVLLPLTFNKSGLQNLSLQTGLRFEGEFTESWKVIGAFGTTIALSDSLDPISGSTSAPAVPTFSAKADLKRSSSRGFAEAGVEYRWDENTSIATSFGARQTPLSSDWDYVGKASVTFRFGK
jgi:hypothetical protein